jgi:uncharacterized protein (TIGR03086 family)
MDQTTLKRACASTDRFLASVTADQLALPTPCAEWDVRALLNHLVGTLALYRALMTGTAPTANMAPGGLPDVDMLDADPVAAYRTGVEGVLAVTDDDALARTHPTPLGDMPGAALCGFSTLDVLVHGWDLARATGQEPTLDPDLAEQLLAFARQAINDDMRAPRIGPEVAVAADAPATDRLVAFMGRTP